MSRSRRARYERRVARRAQEEQNQEEQKRQEGERDRASELASPLCPLCERPIPSEVPQSLHHLIPKLKGGTGGPTVLLHHICHKEIHATLTEAELARDFNTIEALRAHPRLERFIEWVAQRPPEFISRAPSLRRRR